MRECVRLERVRERPLPPTLLQIANGFLRVPATVNGAVCTLCPVRSKLCEVLGHKLVYVVVVAILYAVDVA